MAPQLRQDEDGEVMISGIHTYGDTVHLFIERKNYNGVFLPQYQAHETSYKPESVGLRYVDHIVGNVGWFEMNKWCEFYKNVCVYMFFVIMKNYYDTCFHDLGI